MNKNKLNLCISFIMGSLAYPASYNALAQPPSSESADQAEPELREEVIVHGFQRDYLQNSAASAVGLDLSLKETPAAISVITQDILQDQQVNNVDDALRNVAGVTKFKTGNGGEEKFSIRGFDASQSIYKDGARINNALNVSNIPSTETANIERIDVLKGPSALLYGQGEPGGIINYITKKPQFETVGSLEILAGNENFNKIEGDYGSAIDSNNRFAFRVVGAYEDSESFRNAVERQRLLLNPTLLWQFTEEGSLLIGYEYIDDDYTNERGQVLELTNPQANPSQHNYAYTDRINIEDFFGIPGWNNQTTVSSERLYLTANYTFTPAWRLEATYSTTSSEKDNFDSSPSPLVSGSDLVSIGPRKSIGEGEAEQITLKNFIDFDDAFGFEHEILASLTHENANSESVSFRADRNQTDRGNVFFNIVSGEYFANFTAEEAADPDFVQIDNNIGFILRARDPLINDDREESGLNILDFMRINESWSVLFGGRFSEYKDKLGDAEEDNFSARLGLVYEPNAMTSIYASFSEGFTPSIGLLGEDDRTVDPEESTAYEIGVKWSLNDEKLLLTAAVFEVELEGIPFVINPFDENGMETPFEDLRYNNLGSVQTEGLELELVGFIQPNWRIQGGYAYIDNEIADGGTGEFGSIFPRGNRFPGIAAHNFNLFSFYEIPIWEGELGLGAGAFFQGDTFISTENRGEYDGWTTFDLAAYFKKNQWKAQLNIRNISDEEYRLAQALTTSDGFAAIRVGTSTPRTITASLAYEF